MSLQIPIIGYALAEGSGKLAMSAEGKKNASNLSAVSKAMSWIEEHAAEVIGGCGVEHAERKTPFLYFDGSRVTFDPVLYAKTKLEEILDHFAGQKIALMVPSREYLLSEYQDDITRRIWDRRTHGFSVQILSVECNDFPLRSSAPISSRGILDHLIQNAVRTEVYMINSVNGSKANAARRRSRQRRATSR